MAYNDINSYYYAVRAIYSDGESLCTSDLVKASFTIAFNFIEPGTGNPVTQVDISFNGQDLSSSFLSSKEFFNVFFGSNTDVVVEHNDYSTLNGSVNFINADAIYNVFMGESIEPLSTSIEEQIEETDEMITVYPNPSSGVFFLSNTEKYENSKIRVSDITGKIIYNKNLTSTIDLSNYPKGIYNLQITSDKKSINKTLIIQ